MGGIKTARIKADREAEMVRMLSLNKHMTTAQLAKMFSVRPGTIIRWKHKNGISTERPVAYNL